MYKAKNNLRERKGFTLIELLIVVAIIGILAAIAIPAFLGQQKKAKWRTLMVSCEGAGKQATAMLNDFAKLDPIVLLANSSSRVCYAHAMKTQVDSNGDGAPDKSSCAAKFADFAANSGTYGAASTTVVTEFASGIIREACGPTLGASGMGISGGNIYPDAGLGKASPYLQNKCIYITGVTIPNAVGQCLIIPNESAKTMQLVAVEDKGDGTAGETKSWVVTGE